MSSLIEALQLYEGCEWTGERDAARRCIIFPCGLQVADEIVDVRTLDADEAGLIRNAHRQHHYERHSKWIGPVWARSEHDGLCERVVEAGCCDSWKADKKAAWK